MQVCSSPNASSPLRNAASAIWVHATRKGRMEHGGLVQPQEICEFEDRPQHSPLKPGYSQLNSGPDLSTHNSNLAPRNSNRGPT